MNCRPSRASDGEEDGTKGHKRQRDSHAGLHMLRVSVPSAYSEDMRPSTKCWEKSLRSKVFHCAELRDGTRDSVLALKPHAVPHAVLRRSRSFIIHHSSFIIFLKILIAVS